MVHRENASIKAGPGRADADRMDATLLARRTAASDHTRKPARPPLVARLPRTCGLRRRTALGLLIAGPMALATSLAVLAMVVAAPTLPGHLFGAVIGAACAAATVWWL